MTEAILNWLNKEIILSKYITDISKDFRNGYYFAELLYKAKQIPKLSIYKNTNNPQDIISNFCHIQKNLLDMKITLDEQSRNDIIKGGVYTSTIYLLKIKQVLDQKLIDLNQIRIKESNELQMLYNKMCFKNDNEKYLYNLHMRFPHDLQTTEKKTLKKNYSSGLPMMVRSTDTSIKNNALEDKYEIGGNIYSKLKKRYAHLELNEEEYKILLDDMKDKEEKNMNMKDNIMTIEKKREKMLQQKDKEEIKNWNENVEKMESCKEKRLLESWDPVKKYKHAVNNAFRNSSVKCAEMSKDFDKKLKFLIGEDGLPAKKEKFSTEILMLQMREKLNEKIKSKKDKEKRERKRLKEEQEMFDKCLVKKNMDDMINNMNKNLKKSTTASNYMDMIKLTDNLLKENQTKEKNEHQKILKEQQEQQKLKEEAEKAKNKEGEDKKKTISKNSSVPSPKGKKASSKSSAKNNKQNESEANNQNKSQGGTDNAGADSNNNELQNKNKNEDILEKMKNTASSIYSRLTEGDRGLNLINDCLSLHNRDININDRIKLFKTLILPINSEEIKKKYNDLPKVPDIYSEYNESLQKNNSASNIFSDVNSSRNINKFNTEEYFDELNKIELDIFTKCLNEKKEKKEKKKNLLLPLTYKMIDIAEYIAKYQMNKGVDLIDNSKWDELMTKFSLWEPIDDDDENGSKLSNDGDSEYVFDYGEKISIEDDQKIFDYVNYINIFNDLIIANEARGKKYPYPDLYKEFYCGREGKDDKIIIDIKDYEPNSFEIENLSLPVIPNFSNYKFSDVIENILDYKYNNNANNFISNSSKQINKTIKRNNSVLFTDIEQKGKYFFVPIKICVSGYPLSGKKTQCQFISQKYPGIKIYDPAKLLEDKVQEYKTIKDLPEKHAGGKEKKGKHQDNKDNKDNNAIKDKDKDKDKDKEERLKQFEPVLKIISPYLEMLNKKKEEEKRLNETNSKSNANETKTSLINDAKNNNAKKKKKKGKQNSKNENENETNNNNKNANENNPNNNNSGGNENNINNNETNTIINSNTEAILQEKNELLSDIYMNLLIYEIKKDFPDDKESRNKFLEDLNSKYSQYTTIKQQLKDIQEKIKEEEAKQNEEKPNDKKNQKKSNVIIQNLHKEYDNVSKQYESITNSLYIGFIIINYPKNFTEAKKLENFFTGYVSEFEKEPEESDKKLFSYSELIDVNIKQKTNISLQMSLFDLFIEMNITSEESERRFKGAKYDPGTKKIYHMEDNPPPDKKLNDKLVAGLPNMNSDEFFFEKNEYEKNVNSLRRFYKNMKNGFCKVYKTVEQMDKNNLNNINNSLENAIEEIMFNNFYNNIESILTLNQNQNQTKEENINKTEGKKEDKEENNKIETQNEPTIENKKEEKETKEKEKDKDKEKGKTKEKGKNKGKDKDKEKDKEAKEKETKEKEEKEKEAKEKEAKEKEAKEKEAKEKEAKDKEKGINKLKEDLHEIKEVPTESNNNEASSKNIKISNNNSNVFIEEIYNQLDSFSLIYKSLIKNFIHFISRQKEHTIKYLTDIQNTFITFINRKINKTEIAELYLKKYNTMVEAHPELKNNPLVYNEFLDDIKDVNKSIWVKIQSKKNDDVNYLQQIKHNGKKEEELKKFWEFSLAVVECEVQKYLVLCEILIKYYLAKNGLLENVYGILDINNKMNKKDEFLFKIDYKKYLYENLPQDDPNANNNNEKQTENNNNNNNINGNNNSNSNKETIDANNSKNNTLTLNFPPNNKRKLSKLHVSRSQICKGAIDINNNNKMNNNTLNNKTIITHSLHSTRTDLNRNINNSIKDKTEILLVNALKIIIRQDIIVKNYVKRIKALNEKNPKVGGASLLASKNFLNSSVSSKSSQQKRKITRKTKLLEMGAENIFYEEELISQIRTEKRKFKYRLMFLKYFIIKYYNNLNMCFNDVYSSLDDWIIMSVRAQNNSLNEFINYLRRALNRYASQISLDNFEFDSYDIYRRYKVDVSSLYDKIYFNCILSPNKDKDDKILLIDNNIQQDNINENNENIIDINKFLINEEEMSYVQKFVYNINDLMYLYNYLKTFGCDSCNYLVKFDIVKEILIHQNFVKKKYELLLPQAPKGNKTKKDNTNNNNYTNTNGNTNTLNNQVVNTLNSSVNGANNNNNNNNNNITANNLLNQINYNKEENNGICKKLLLISNVNYMKFLSKFSVYNSNYININELFTTLLLIGSELIHAEKLKEMIKEYLPEEKKESKNILLTHDEFMKIIFWFEKDEYLNSYADQKESEIYIDQKKYEENPELFENSDKTLKINSIKESIFDINSEDNKIDINKIVKLFEKINEKKIEEGKVMGGTGGLAATSGTSEKEIFIKTNEDQVQGQVQDQVQGIVDEKKSEKDKEKEKDVNIPTDNGKSSNEVVNSLGKDTESKITVTLTNQSDFDVMKTKMLMNKKIKKKNSSDNNDNNIFTAVFLN